jgi:acetyl esterase/lipase
VFRSAVTGAVLFFAGAAVVGPLGWYWSSSGRVSGQTYAAPDGLPLTLDIDYPARRGAPPPVILFAPHDGEWKPEMRQEPRCRSLLTALTGHGYAVATVHYRLPGKYRFPAQVEDGKSAVRWLRANAGRFGLNAERIGAIGVSAGGYGICMLGTTGPGDGLDGPGDDPRYSSRVQAVVAMGAPAGFGREPMPPIIQHLYLRPFLGASFEDDPELYARASPGTYASADDPPFLLFHSRNDLSVPVTQARSFAGELRQAGVQVELVEEDGYEHVWTGPKFDRAVERTLEFFDRHLLTAPPGLSPSANLSTTAP